ncbi:BamA/TamA family outer membrane protein [Olivibacter sp. CPCC 100613]|uniref:BamA/TamA family outer membrane protein n=1 Tax=Olivibacter sp. CPCC 100613 TaxID=3079931 RepID=UPI002FFCE836
MVFLRLGKTHIICIYCFLLVSAGIFRVHAQQAITLQERINPVLPLSVNELPDRILFQQTNNQYVVHEFALPGRGVGGLMTFSPDGQFFVVSGDDRLTTVYALNSDTIRQLTQLPFKTKLAAFNSAKEEWIFVHSVKAFNAKISKYRASTWEAIATRNIASDINALSISNDGKLIGFTNSRLIQFLDYESFAKIQVNWQKEKQRLLTFNPQKQELASVTDRNSIQIRDFSDNLIQEIKTDQSKIAWITYDPTGNYLVSTDEEGRLSVWNLTKKERIKELSSVFIPPTFTENNELLIKNNRNWTKIKLTAPVDASDGAPYLAKQDEHRLKLLPQPIIGFTRETGLSLGAGVTMIWYPKADNQTKFSQPTVFVPTVSYGFNGKQLAVGAYMEAYYKNKWHFINNFLFTNNSKNYFFGVGKESDDRNKTTYVSDNFILDGSISRILADRFFIGLNYRLRKDSELNFEKEPFPDFYGRNGGWLFGIGPTLRMDKRNDILFPTKGSFLEINYYWFNKDVISDYHYHELKFDYRKFMPVNWLVQGDALAVQAMFNGTWGGEVPFYQLPYMTADRAFRGVWRHLYIAEQVFAVQAEYRSYFSSVDHRFGYAIFAGLGDGAKNFFKDYQSSIKAFYGVGFRQQLIPKYRLDTRMDFGLTSKGDFGFFVGTGVAF